jgi:hypothetical protein
MAGFVVASAVNSTLRSVIGFGWPAIRLNVMGLGAGVWSV